MSTTHTIRQLTADEISTLSPILSTQGWTEINPEIAVVFGAFSQSDPTLLLGFIALQFFPVVGPLYVNRSFRHTPIAASLVSHLSSFIASTPDITGYLTICEDPTSVHFAERCGMKRLDFPVYLGAGGQPDGRIPWDRRVVGEDRP